MAHTSRLYDTLNDFLLQLWTIQRVLRQVECLMPDDVAIVLLADQGFADGKLMKYLQENLGWHFRIRIKRSFQFQLEGEWRKVSSVQLQPGQAYFTPQVSVGKTKPYANIYLAFAHDRQRDEDCLILQNLFNLLDVSTNNL